MSGLSRQSTIDEWVKDEMSRTAVFEELEIDFCCGGNKTLQDACREKGLDLDAVVERLISAGGAKTVREVTDWASLSVSELVDHILSTHHAYLKEAIPSLTELVDKVVHAHEERHPELARVKSAVRELFDDLQSHLMKEENILFPLAISMNSKIPAGEFHCSSARGPVMVMRHEHDQANRLLDEIRDATRNYKMPQDGCASYQLMLNRLKEFEVDLHVHIHKENDVLFPGILELELSRQGS
ncbi:hypothetical protein UZ36_08030 [Candidatus Nitromaritima sp. SCGC AAA799-C22]|nr:hypothetical protein UZ36_08030 [Candidatus Nitromaritima sp. SCGC AAA799-C22]